MNPNGFIKLHRKIQNWKWFFDRDMYWFWTWLLMEADYEEQKVGEKVIPKGSLVCSLQTIHFNTRYPIQKIRTMLSKLKEDHQITIESRVKYSIYTIINYADYHADDPALTSKSTSSTTRQLTTGQDSTSYNIVRKKVRRHVGDQSPPPITFDSINHFLHITQARLELWGKAYPQVDLQAEINKAAVWLDANPMRTKSNYAKFLTNWFARTTTSKSTSSTTLNQRKPLFLNEQGELVERDA